MVEPSVIAFRCRMGWLGLLGIRVYPAYGISWIACGALFTGLSLRLRPIALDPCFRFRPRLWCGFPPYFTSLYLKRLYASWTFVFQFILPVFALLCSLRLGYTCAASPITHVTLERCYHLSCQVSLQCWSTTYAGYALYGELLLKFINRIQFR